MECPQTIPLIKRLYYLPALPLRGRQALRHLADLSDSSGSDSSWGALRQAVLSVGCPEGGGRQDGDEHLIPKAILIATTPSQHLNQGSSPPPAEVVAPELIDYLSWSNPS